MARPIRRCSRAWPRRWADGEASTACPRRGRGGAWAAVIARRRICVRHCEAAKRPKQSRRAVPRILCGRRAVWPCPILDCVARAPRGLAMTGGGRAASREWEAGAPPCPPSLRGREAAEAIQAGGAANPVREAYRVAAPILDCFALASLALAMTGGGRAASRGRAASCVALPDSGLLRARLRSRSQ